jgi:hypothetical protein
MCTTAVHNQERSCRVDGTHRDPQIFRFMKALAFGVAFTLVGFAATVVHYSDPTRDSSFRSKHVITTFLSAVAVVTILLVSVDMWAHFSDWKHKVPAFILQV